MEENRFMRKKEIIALTVFTLGVIVVRLFYISRTKGPFIYADEMGYWSHAAHMTGNIWAGVMDGVSWYSFGYSFWLALTFFFSHDMEVMFHIAVLMNALMGLATFALAYRICTRLFVDGSKELCGLFAFTVTSFPTYIFYSHTTMSETLVNLMVWLLFYELISLEERPCWWKGLILGATAVYAFMVHNRLLVLAIAAVLCMILLWIVKKVDWKVVAAFVLAACVCALFYVWMKRSLGTMLVQNQVVEAAAVSVTQGSANTFGQMVQKFKSIFSLTAIKYTFLSLLGQLWQCMASTYLLLGVGLVFCVKKLVSSLKEKAKITMFLYPLLAFLGMVSLSTVAFITYDLPQIGEKIRMDPAFYGRYNECVFPMLILMALVMMIQGVRSEKKVYGALLVCFACLSAVMYVRLYGIENGYLNIVSAVGIHIFHWLGEFSVIKCFVTGIFVFTIIVELCHIRMPKQYNYYLICCMLIFLFFFTALYCMKVAIRGENDNTARFNTLFEYLNENTNPEDNVYICDENKMAFDVQTRLVDKPVISITIDQLDERVGDSYVVVPEEQMGDIDSSAYSVCLSTEGYAVIKAQ